jgi:hypothetical protein
LRVKEHVRICVQRIVCSLGHTRHLD